MLNYDCSILFTTRYRYEDRAGMELAELAYEDRRALMARFYPKTDKHQKTVKEIIETVHGHTLAVELAARLLKSPKRLQLFLRLRHSALISRILQIKLHGIQQHRMFFSLWVQRDDALAAEPDKK